MRRGLADLHWLSAHVGSPLKTRFILCHNGLGLVQTISKLERRWTERVAMRLAVPKTRGHPRAGDKTLRPFDMLQMIIDHASARYRN